jgi:hypothetical protein
MRHAVALDRDIGGQLQSRGVDGAIAWLATRQHGVVSRAQLLAAGFGADAIQHRIVTQRLHPVFRGVYAAGHARLTRQGRWMASVLAAGEGAVLSHRSAAALWGLRQTNGRVEVTIRPGRRGPPRLTVHRSSLPFDEVTEHDGIPVTTVSRTLLDSAAGMRPDQIERMLREAEFLRLTDPVGIDVLLERHPRRAGSRTLRRAVNEMNDSIGRTRSELRSSPKPICQRRKRTRRSSWASERLSRTSYGASTG